MATDITQKLSDWTNGDSASLAEVEGVSESTVARELRVAKAWLIK